MHALLCTSETVATALLCQGIPTRRRDGDAAAAAATAGGDDDDDAAEGHTW